MTSTVLGNQCFKTCSWIPLTMVKSLLLNSALQEISIPAQLLIVHMQNQYWTKFGIQLQFAESTYICGIILQLRNPEQLALFACCRIRNKTNVPTKFTLPLYVCGIHWKFVRGIHLLFGTYFKTCLWNSGSYRHNIVLLSSPQFGLWKNFKCFFNLICLSSFFEYKDCLLCTYSQFSCIYEAF